MNYVIFGVMFDLCHGHFLTVKPTEAGKFTEKETVFGINFYKGTGFRPVF